MCEEKFAKSVRKNATWKKKIEARCGDSYLSFLPRQRQEDLYELEASLVYKSVSGQVGLLQKETLSQKTKSNSNFHCQETPLTGKFSSSGESSLGDESEAYFPPKLCLSEDKLGWGSEPEGWFLSLKAGFWAAVNQWLLAPPPCRWESWNGCFSYFFVPLVPHGKQEGV